MKRLFILRDQNNRPFMGIPSSNGPLSFPTKQAAKERRDEINNAKLYDFTLHVSPGPDHHNYKA